jgi:hypothetical protein
MSDFKDQKQELQGLRSQIQEHEKAILKLGDQVQSDPLPDEERDDPKAQDGGRRNGQKA